MCLLMILMKKLISEGIRGFDYNNEIMILKLDIILILSAICLIVAFFLL